MEEGPSPRAWLFRCCWLLLAADILLGVAYLLWSEYEWAQARRSYFNLQQGQTPASWLASMQLAAAAGFAAVAFRRERRRRGHGGWGWIGIAALILLGSLSEVARDPGRRGWVTLAAADPFHLLLVTALATAALASLGWLVLVKVSALGAARRWAAAWLSLWGGALVVAVAAAVDPPVTDSMRLTIDFLTGLGFLTGTTALLAAFGGHAIAPTVEDSGGVDATAVGAVDVRAAPSAARAWLLAGIFGSTFAVIVLQSLLLRALGIFGDYVTAHGVLSIALLGVAAGALLGYGAATRGFAQAAALGASLLLPVSILTTYGAIVVLGDTSLATALLLAMPFLLASVAVSAVLALDAAHRVYCADLLGAAVGALMVGPALGRFREEGSLLLLAAVAFLPAWAFARAHPARRVRRAAAAVCVTGAGLVGWLGIANGERDWFNLGREQVRYRYPEAAVLYSRSSLAGRYDVIRRWRAARSISAFENGWVTDTIRPRPPAEYRIDPRLPHNLIEDPVILILGLSGDGITKTARAIGTKVYGVEINPAVVALQTGALVEHNGAAYDGIEVSVGDGRTFVETSTGRYDIITLLNAHAARGRAEGRAPSPEYLHTREAFAAYLDHLTERGVVIVEEPVGAPWREVPVWKLLWTMRAVLLERGAADPARHVVVFQWRTPTNRYLQILMRKTPFAADEIGRLRGWLDECDRRGELEAAAGQRLGPITTRTTLLHAPDEATASNVSRVIRGDVGDWFLRARGLEVITDDRPFYFDVDPERSAVRGAYARTGLLLLVVLLPAGLVCVMRATEGAQPERARRDSVHPSGATAQETHSEETPRRRVLLAALPHAQIAVLSGIGYLLLETVLLQRYTIFLGSPLATFATVLGTMLTCSGIGSLWSGRLGARGAGRAAVAIIVLIGAQALIVPRVFTAAAALSFSARVIVAAAALAPLALAMGVPFPYAMRAVQGPAGRAAAALLFALNAAAGAIAVPLAMSLGTRWGLGAVLAVAAITYAVVGVLIGAGGGVRLRRAASVAAAALIVLLLASPVVRVPSIPLIPPPAPDSAAMPIAEASSGVRARQGAALWRVYAARYGRSRVGADRIFADGRAEEVRPFGWFYWIVRGGGRTILVDTGFDDARQARDWDITGYVRPAERLAALGIEPEDVTDIVLTHAHWDHMGGIGAYPRARIHIQEAEYRHALDSVGAGRPRRHGIRWQDVRALRAAEAEGRLVRVAGDTELFPGVRLVAGGGHTPGSQWVEVETIDGAVVIAGDAVTQDENNAWRRAIAQTADPAANLATLRRMQTRAASLFLIVPGHDPDIETWFPRVAPGVVEVTARARVARLVDTGE